MNRLNELGNQIHNLGCEHQNDEELSEKLRDLALEAWDISKIPTLEWAIQRCEALKSQGFERVNLDVLLKDFRNCIEAHTK